MTNAIEQLCAMLDERGVEYDFTDRLFEVPSYQSVTWWFNTADKATFREYHDSSTQLIVHSSKHGITPEEAIAATLGPRTCHNEAAQNCRDYWFCCSECEFVAHTNKTAINYCPNCGRKVVDE